MQAPQFIFKDRYVKVECPLPEMGGFFIEARLNLTNGELLDLKSAMKDINERVQEIIDDYPDKFAGIEDARAALDAERAAIDQTDAAALSAWDKAHKAEYRTLARQTNDLVAEQNELVTATYRERRGHIAPYIRSWNLFELGGDGKPVAVDPPQVAGASVFANVDDLVTDWAVDTCLTAYRSGKGLGSTKSADVPEPGNEPTGGPKVVEPSSRTRASRKTSV